MIRQICFLLVAAAAMVSAAWAAGSAAAGQPIVTTDLLLIRTVNDIDISADGAWAVAAVQSIAEESDRRNDRPKYAYRRHLYLLDLTDPDAQPRRLTHGSRNDRSPVFSPDGRFIAFIRGSEDEGGSSLPQLWLLPLDGGEARQVTTFEHGAGNPQWSPDGRRILVTTRIPMRELEGDPPWSIERPRRALADVDDDVEPRPDGTREQIRKWLAVNEAAHNPVVITGLDFQEEARLRRELRLSQIAIVENPDRPEPSVRMITNGFAEHRAARFTPDGRRIVFTSKRSDTEHLDRIERYDLWQINLDGSNEQELLVMDEWSMISIEPSADGSVIAFTARSVDEPGYRPRRLGLMANAGPDRGQTVWLTDEQTFDAPVRGFAWKPGRTEIVFTSARRGAFPMLTITPGLLRPDVLVEEDNGLPIGVYEFAVGNGAIVYAQSSPENPCVLRIRDAEGDRLLWDLNSWTADRALSMPRERTVRRPDGTEIQFWVMEPTNRRPGGRYPLVLQIHGGPAVMWGPGERSMWHEFQLFCSWGYGVVYANPRGSSGYGYQFQRANHRNWGDGPAGDVLAAVDQCLLLEWVDADRLVVTGGSYGGYLTAWIIGHDHRFKAAVAQRGVYDLTTFFGEGNAWRLVRRSTDGWPYEPRMRDVMRQLSPFTYVQRIRTPLLIKHGDNDLRTGVSQSEMLYRALKVLGRPVEFVRYPGADHNLSRGGDPLQRLDRLNRMLEFFERHIDNPRPAPQHTANESGQMSGPTAGERQ